MSLGKLFIGGLSWETSTESLEAYYKQFGEVADAIIMKDRNTGLPRGFGFVTYADQAVAEKVCQEKHSIDGRTVDTKLAVARDQMPAAEARPDQAGPRNTPMPGPDCKKLFVGGLPASATEDSMKAYFGQFGSIQEILIMSDKTTGASRGFGFLTFDESSSGAAAVQQGRMHVVDGKQVEIKPAESRETRTMKNQAFEQHPAVGNYGAAQYGAYGHGGGGPMRGGYGKGGAAAPQGYGYGQQAYGQPGYPMQPYGGYGGPPQDGYGASPHAAYGVPPHAAGYGASYGAPEGQYTAPPGYGQQQDHTAGYGQQDHTASYGQSAPVPYHSGAEVPPPPFQASAAQQIMNPQDQMTAVATAVALETVMGQLAGQLAEIKNTNYPPAQAHAAGGAAVAAIAPAGPHHGQPDSRQHYHPYAR